MPSPRSTPSARPRTRPRSAPSVRSPTRPRTSSARPRSAPARMMTAAFYKRMTPVQQLHYRKTVKVSQWPTDKRASKALLMVVLASMFTPAQGLLAELAAGLGAAKAVSWAYIAYQAGRWYDLLSSHYGKGVVAAIIILAFYRTYKNSQNKAAKRAAKAASEAANRAEREKNRAAKAASEAANRAHQLQLFQLAIQGGLRNPPAQNALVFQGVPAVMAPAQPLALLAPPRGNSPRQASPARAPAASPARGNSPRRATPTNNQLIANMPNRVRRLRRG